MRPGGQAHSPEPNEKDLRSGASNPIPYCDLIAEFTAQPSPGHSPVTRDGGRRDLQRFGCLINGHAAKITKFKDSALAWIDSGKTVEGGIDGHQLVRAFVRHHGYVTERQCRQAVTTFRAPAVLPHRVGKGHVTPERVLHSNFGCCIGTIKKSATYKVSGAAERRAVAIWELVENKEQQERQQLNEKNGTRRVSRHPPNRKPSVRSAAVKGQAR